MQFAHWATQPNAQMCSSQHTCAAVVVRHTLLLYKQCNTARITVQQYIVIGSKALHFPVHKMVVDSSHDLLTDGDSISRLNPKLFRVLNRVSWADLEIENFVSAKWNVAEIYIFYLERGEADVISWVSCSVRLLYENLLVWQRNNGRNFSASVIFQTRNFSWATL